VRKWVSGSRRSNDQVGKRSGLFCRRGVLWKRVGRSITGLICRFCGEGRVRKWVSGSRRSNDQVGKRSGLFCRRGVLWKRVGRSITVCSRELRKF